MRLAVLPLILLAQIALRASEIHVRLCSNGVHESLVKAARHETEFLLGTAGVHIKWLRCDTGSEPLALTLGLMASARTPSTLGSALPESHAAIFYANVRQFLQREAKVADEHVLLGAVMAHEIAHLLTGPRHGTGLLRANWSRADLLRMNQRRLRFSPAQAERIRHAADVFASARAVIARWPETRDWIRDLVRKEGPIRPAVVNSSYTAPRCRFARN